MGRAAAGRQVAGNSDRLDLAVTEQELDEAAAHIGAFGRGHSHRCGRALGGWIGVDHGGFLDIRGLVRHRLMESSAEKRRAGKKRKILSVGHRRTLYCFVVGAPERAPLHATS